MRWHFPRLPGPHVNRLLIRLEASVSSSFLKIDVTLEILSFEVWTSDVIEVLKMFDTTGKNLRSWVRQGFKPYDFFCLVVIEFLF